MIYSKLNAFDAYSLGLKTRLDQKSECGAMSFAIYKIIECDDDFRSTKDEFFRIGQYCRGNSMYKYEFLHCVYLDMHIWAKDMSAHNCFSLARNLVGVLEALPGDGINCGVIKYIQNEVERRIPALLTLGESARIESKTAWGYTSKLLGTGECLLDKFNNECIEIIEWVMEEIIASNPTCPSGPYSSYVNGRHRRKLKGNANALPH